MVKVVIIDKNCNKKESSLKQDRAEFYKKCNYRNNKNFDMRHTWEFNEEGETYYITIFAKDNGRAGSENKYDLPPPIDSNLYYGTLMLVKTFNKNSFEKDNLDDLLLADWEKCYEKLFGGFESLGEDSEESDELDDISDSEKTKEGYHKDGFVVGDDEEDDDYIPEDEDEEETEAEETEETDEEVMGKDSEIEDEEEEEDEDEYDTEDEEVEILDSELSEESYISDED